MLPARRGRATQRAEQYRLRPAWASWYTVLPSSCGIFARPPRRALEGAGGPPTVAQAAPSNCMVPGPDGSDGTLRHRHYRVEQARCQAPWPAIAAVYRQCDASASDPRPDSCHSGDSRRLKAGTCAGGW